MQWSAVNKVGLILLALCGAATVIPWPMPADAQNGPPKWVVIAGLVLGIITVLAVIHAWLKSNKGSALVAVALSLINAALAVPAFFVSGVPMEIRRIAAVYVVVTVVAVAMTLAPNRTKV